MNSKFDPFFEPCIFRNVSPIFPQYVVMEYGFDVSEPDQLSPSPGHSFETLVRPLRGGKTPNLAGREIGNMEVR